ncbi:hypothetical protein LTR85_011359 [Meristemomyces frigidus]|nr:hypothetical protein LTR85_011359 [Meristemomyces frigidus]
MSSNSSPRTPKSTGSPKDEAARILLRMSQSGASPSPSRSSRLPPTTTAPQAGGAQLENAMQQGRPSAVRRVTSPLRPAPAEARYSESSGRFIAPVSERPPPPRIGPLADRTRPGQYLPITRQNQPDAFRSAQEMQEVAQWQRDHPLNAHVSGGSRPASVSVAESEPESDIAEEDDDKTGDYNQPGPSHKAKGKQPALPTANPRPMAGPNAGPGSGSGNTTATSNGDHRAWKFGQPQPGPLAFRVPTGATSYKDVLLPADKRIDFNNRASVNAANRYARQIILRARTALGLPPLRPSTQGREYDQERDDILEYLIDEYAAQNNGAQISNAELADLYNDLYPGENRTSASIASHVGITPELRAARAQYQ